MQKSIISKTEKVAKEGKQTFYTVYFQDNSKATTFDAKIEQALAGNSLEWEPVIKGNYVNIKEGFIITKGASPPAMINGQAMNPELWAEKDRLDRRSREAIACFDGIVELVKTGIKPTDRLQTVYDVTLDWALAHFQPVKAEPIGAQQAKVTTDTPGEFKDRGDFLTKVTKATGLKTAGICEKLSINDVKEITDFKKDWKTLTGKESEKEEGGELTPENLPFS